MRVEISAAAEKDIMEIGRFIAHDSPDRALAFVDELEAACFGLADFPKRYPSLEGAHPFDVRRRTVGNYLVLYRIVSDAVMILRVVNGSMDLEKLLNTL
jgi:toxin ParE1/3/4